MEQVFGDPAKQALYIQVVDALNAVFGVHPGFRAAHAKGVVCRGTFRPAATAASLSCAGHFQTTAVPVTVRFSNSTGVPNIPDFDPHATPKGMAVKFHVPGVGDTDIVAASSNGFPVSTAEEFLEFVRAIAGSGPDAAKPTPTDRFLSTHPRTLAFLALPKPTPASYGSESYFALNAFRFINREGARRFGRYFIRPVGGNQYLDQAEAEKKSPDFLAEEIATRLAAAPVDFRLSAQLALPGDPTHDGSSVWPDDRPQVELGILSLTERAADSDAAQKALIFDPSRLSAGIELGDDPLPLDRSGVYAVSYARRNP